MNKYQILKSVHGSLTTMINMISMVVIMYAMLSVIVIGLRCTPIPITMILYVVPISVGLLLHALFETVPRGDNTSKKGARISRYEEMLHLSILVPASFISLVLFLSDKLIFCSLLLVFQCGYTIFALHRRFVPPTNSSSMLSPAGTAPSGDRTRKPVVIFGLFCTTVAGAVLMRTAGVAYFWNASICLAYLGLAKLFMQKY